MHRSKHISPPADRVSEKGSALQKDPALIVYEEHPLNIGTPPACARQTDQPQDVRQVWNWKGYLNHAWHRVQIKIPERVRS